MLLGRLIANEVMKKQELELQELRNVVQEKEKELEASMTDRKLEELLKVAKANLKKNSCLLFMTLNLKDTFDFSFYFFQFDQFFC